MKSYHKKCLSYYKNALSQQTKRFGHQNHPDLLLGYATMCEKMGKMKEARSNYTKIISTPGYMQRHYVLQTVEAYSRRGCLYEKDQNFFLALQDYNKVQDNDGMERVTQKLKERIFLKNVSKY
jgi:tetratricopeptide (TPR) repeat protein